MVLPFGEQRLAEKISSALPGVAPGVCLKAFHKGKLHLDLQVGKTYQFYDWASLTKVVFAVSAVMAAFEEKRIKLDSLAQETLPWWPARQTSLQELLTHTSGLEWWRPYYKKIDRSLDQLGRWQQLQDLLRLETPKRNQKSVYSDLNLLLLGFWLERIYEKPLSEIWKGIAEDFHLESTHFNLDNQRTSAKNLYAPTENCPWRKKLLQGEVHDQNTWALGGVAPHAGLFGSMDDLSLWALQLRKAHLDEGALGVISPKTVRKFTKRAVLPRNGDWALGFMLPSPESASCGDYFSESSFGHTGFTGTSVWFDPKEDFLVMILSNRENPVKKNLKFPKLRRQMHDWAYQTVVLKESL